MFQINEQILNSVKDDTGKKRNAVFEKTVIKKIIIY